MTQPAMLERPAPASSRATALAQPSPPAVGTEVVLVLADGNPTEATIEGVVAGERLDL